MKNLFGTHNSKTFPLVFVASNSGGSGSAWVMDTCATYHLTHDSSNLENVTLYPGHDSVLVRNVEYLTIAHIGSIVFPSQNKYFCT